MTHSNPDPQASSTRRLLLWVSSLSVLLLGAAFLLSGPAAAEEPGPLVVKIHADWCGTCTRMEPSWESAENALGSSARFVILDVTDADKLAASRKQAEALGIVAFFDAHQAKTGTVGVLSSTGETAATFKGELEVETVRAAIGEASTRAGA